MARWALISGGNGTENAACALKVVARLATRGIRAAGFVQRKHVDEEGRKRYELVRLGGGESVVLAVDGVAAKGPTEEFFCSMAFHQEGFDAARRWLEEDAPTSDLLVLDGISKLEVSGKGHCATLEAALCSTGKVVLLCARAHQLVYVVERFGLEEADMVAALELPADDTAFDTFLRHVGEGCCSLRVRV
jgi:nucleoside-triphosphatase THEP1